MASITVHESLRSLTSTVPLAERVTFGSVFDGLFLKAFGKELTPGFRAKLKQLGVDLDHLRAGDPFSTFRRA